MKLDRRLLKPCSSPLIGFIGHHASVERKIKLMVTLGDDKRRQSMVPVEFILIKIELAYNAILGRPSFCILRAAFVPYCQADMFLTAIGEGRARSDQEATKRCYVVSTKMKIPYSDDRSEPMKNGILMIDMLNVRSEFHRKADTLTEEVVNVAILPEGSGRFLKIGTLLLEGLKEKLVLFLKNNLDAFAWIIADMPGVNMEITVHELNIDENASPVKLRKRNIGRIKQKAAKEEVLKLLATDFITEVQYPTWLSNLVTVPKKDESWRMCVDFTDPNQACPKDSFRL